MIEVGLLTIEQKNELVGKLYTTDSYFNPIQDINNNWVISINEINECSNTELNWVKDLDIIEFSPKPYINPLQR